MKEAINYIRTWDEVLADLQFELDKNKKIPGEYDYCYGLGFAMDIMNDDLELEKEIIKNIKESD